jgi:hypothetical protein
MSRAVIARDVHFHIFHRSILFYNLRQQNPQRHSLLPQTAPPSIANLEIGSPAQRIHVNSKNKPPDSFARSQKLAGKMLKIRPYAISQKQILDVLDEESSCETLLLAVLAYYDKCSLSSTPSPNPVQLLRRVLNCLQTV